MPFENEMFDVKCGSCECVGPQDEDDNEEEDDLTGYSEQKAGIAAGVTIFTGLVLRFD